MSGTGKSYAKLIVTSLLLIGVGTLIIMLGFHMSQSGTTSTSTSSSPKINKAQMEWESQMMERLLHMESEIEEHRQHETQVVVEKEKDEEWETEECDVVIVGAGTGGLVSAHHLAPSLGRKLCLFDERQIIGGKSPSGSDLLRGGDVILRCLAHEMASLVVTRGSMGSFQQPVFLDSSPQKPTSTCLHGICQNPFPSESIYAPNGPTQDATFGKLLNPCPPGQNWTVCSYLSEYYKLLTRAESTKSIGKNDSFRDYMINILGREGATYFRNLWGVGEMERYDARWMLDFLAKDSSKMNGHLREFHQNPRTALWSFVASRIQEKGSRVFLQSRITSIQRIANRRYELLTDTTLKVFAKRVILAIPLGHFSEMSGDVMESLKTSRFYGKIGSFGKCRWNADFSQKWWISLPGFQCNSPKCLTRENEQIDFLLTGSPGVSGLDRVLYRATPEGMANNRLIYEWEGESCQELERIYRENGLIGLKREVMERTRSLLKMPNLRDPLRSEFSSEAFTNPGFLPGSGLTSEELQKWAQQPLEKEPLCIATGSVALDDSGWMEAGAIAAHRCLKILFQANPVEKCTNYGKILEKDGKSGMDNCLLLKGEYHQRDLANLSYCGGSNQFAHEDKLRIPFPVPVYEDSVYHGRSRFIT